MSGIFIKKDFLASIIVFLVALPLCIGVAVACGLPIYSGIISGIIGGIIVGILSGNSLQVSGPAAGLILVVIDIIHTLGVEKLGVVIFFAGIFQLFFGIFRWGRWFRAISPAIIEGMLSGIGITIFLTQFHIMLDSTPQSGFLPNLLDLFQVVRDAVFPLDGSLHHIAGSIGILTIFIIMTWKFLPFKKLKTIPSALVAILASSLIVFVLDLPIKHIVVSHGFWDDFKILNFSLIKDSFNLPILVSAIMLTFVASAETLLTSVAIDKLSPLSKTDYDKEVFAQGIGNTLAGLVGGLPITGVMVRSVANIEAGAQTRLSTVLHGIWILLLISLFPFVLSHIPSAALAAILVYTGIKLVKINEAKFLFKVSKGEFVIYMSTLIGILFLNLFEGVMIGFVMAILKNIYKASKLNIDVQRSLDNDHITVKLSGNLTFIQLPQIIDILEDLEAEDHIFICAEKLYFIDHACIDYIQQWEKKLLEQSKDITVDWAKIKKTYPEFHWGEFNNKK